MTLNTIHNVVPLIVMYLGERGGGEWNLNCGFS